MVGDAVPPLAVHHVQQEVRLMRPLIEVIRDIINDPFLTWGEKGRAVAEVLYHDDPDHVLLTRRFRFRLWGEE